MLRISTDWGPKHDGKSAGAADAASTKSLRETQRLATAQFRNNRVGPCNLKRSMPESCFFEAEIELLFLPADFNWMEPAACEHCKRLRPVDISQTEISETEGHLCTLLAAATASTDQSSVAHWARRPPRLHLLGGTMHPNCFALHRQTSICWLHTAV